MPFAGPETALPATIDSADDLTLILEKIVRPAARQGPSMTFGDFSMTYTKTQRLTEHEPGVLSAICLYSAAFVDPRYSPSGLTTFIADQASQEWFEDAWAVREDSIYRSLFGDIGSGIYALDAELFTGQFRQASVDPRWPFTECLNRRRVARERAGCMCPLGFRTHGRRTLRGRTRSLVFDLSLLSSARRSRNGRCCCYVGWLRSRYSCPLDDLRVRDYFKRGIAFHCVRQSMDHPRN